ncbi:MAG: hypothetical protein ACRDZ5_10995, partial [Acidimicrobiales bacterium]
STNSGDRRLLRIPPVTDRTRPGATVTIPLSFKAVSGSVIRFRVEAVRQVTSVNWYSQSPIVQPFAIASIGVPGLHFTPESPQAPIHPSCRNDLLSIDHKPVYLEASGTVGTAESLGGLVLKGCGPDAAGIHLAAGEHRLTSTAGQLTGLDVDRLSLDSAAGGKSLPPLAGGLLPPVTGTLGARGARPLETPNVSVLSSGPTTARLLVSGAGGPFWLVLGESLNRGWTARIAGKSLGPPVLLDGFANGWHIDGARSSFLVELSFAPQRQVDIALVASAAAILACLLLALIPSRRRRKSQRAHARGPSGQAPAAGTDECAPRLSALWRKGDRRAGPLVAVTTGCVAGGVSFVVLPPEHAVAVAAGLAALGGLAGRWRGCRLVLVCAAVVGTAVAGALTAAGQSMHHYLPGDGWPGHFEMAGLIALVALLALFADALCEIARGVPLSESDDGGRPRRPPRRGPRPPPPPS